MKTIFTPASGGCGARRKTSNKELDSRGGVSKYVPVSTQTVIQNDTHLCIYKPTDELRLWVIFAGRAGAEQPLDLVEDDNLSSALDSFEEDYPAAAGWSLSYRPAGLVPAAEFEALCARLATAAAEGFDEPLGPDAGPSCSRCGGSGTQSAWGDADGICLELFGDCERCFGSGRE